MTSRGAGEGGLVTSIRTHRTGLGRQVLRNRVVWNLLPRHVSPVEPVFSFGKWEESRSFQRAGP